MMINTTIKALAAGIVAAGFFALQAQAAPANFNSCQDVPGQGFAGLACSVAPTDVAYPLYNPKHQDFENNVESVLSYVFGYSIDLNLIVHGLEGDAPGFNFTPNNITNSHTMTVQLSQAYDFATIKAGTYFAIYDIRGLTTLTLSTEDLIVNVEYDKKGKIKKKKGLDISHISFWNLNDTKVPAPAGLAILGMGLLGLGMVRRRR